jgi:endonuclease/exonuclease/phosphatase family metal-dependent hydrolase
LCFDFLQRIVTFGPSFERNVVPNSAKARNFQTEFKLTAEEATAVSDHYPVEIEIAASA